MTLAQYLSESDLTDAEFGAKVGVSQSQISRLKRGVSFPSPATAVRIAQATGGKVKPADWYASLQKGAA